MSNIILIGMPASGKSTLGVMLAKLLGYDFLDTDLLLQKRAGRHLQTVLDEEGAERFKALETEALLSVACEKTVIATGGSAVYSARGMAHLATLGRVIYLSLPLSEVKSRLCDLSTRGVVMEKGETLDTLYATRKALYEKYADLVFDETENGKARTMAQNATELYKLLTTEGKETL